MRLHRFLRRATILCAAVVAAGGASAANAADRPLGGILDGFSGGVLAHGVTLISRAGFEERGAAFNGEIDFAPIFEIFHGTIHPEIGGSVATSNGTSFAYADLRYEILGPANTFFSVGVGGAVHDGHLAPDSRFHNALGSRVLFHLPFEAGFAFAEHYRVSLYYEHISNGYLANPNEGLDNVGLRLGYRF